MKTSTEIFAHNLKTLLEKKHKSQSDLARFLNVTPTTVSRWTNAESLPRSPMIDRICGFLVCDAEDLMTDHTKQGNLFPEDIIADAITERPLLIEYKEKSEVLLKQIAECSKKPPLKTQILTADWKEIYAKLDQEHKRAFWHGLIKQIVESKQHQGFEIMY